jgi:hypothetical protein
MQGKATTQDNARHQIKETRNHQPPRPPRPSDTLFSQPIKKLTNTFFNQSENHLHFHKKVWGVVKINNIYANTKNYLPVHFIYITPLGAGSVDP